jgi:putative hydrolase of the HAD superfamily
MTRTISAVIFDRDNTLTRFDTDAIAARNRRYSAIAPELPAGAVMAHWIHWPGPWPRSATEESAFWAVFWDTLAAQYRLSNRVARALELAGSTYYADFVAYSDAIGCLESLHAQGLRLAVLTNFELPNVHLALLHAGIDPSWFAALLSSSTLGVSKPDPRAYLAAAAALELPPSACVFVDDILKNVEGACHVGMRGVWLDRGSVVAHTPIERIASLGSLDQLIAGRG